MRHLLTLLCLLLALPVVGVLAAWLALDDAALAVLRHQWQTVLPGAAQVRLRLKISASASCGLS